MALCWVIFASYPLDLNIIIPNIIGILFGIINSITFLYLKSNYKNVNRIKTTNLSDLDHSKELKTSHPDVIKIKNVIYYLS